MARACCGQPGRRRRNPAPEPQPPNPKIRNGVRLLYLGGGPERLEGRASGLEYYVSGHRRVLAVAAEDVEALLRRRDLILAPAGISTK